MSDEKRHVSWRQLAQRYILTGIFTCIPIWLTWVVVRFLFGLLSEIGTPWALQFSKALQQTKPDVAIWLAHPWFVSSLAVLLTLVALYLLGWATTRVLGRKLLHAFDSVVGRIPFAEKIYGSTKKLLASLQKEPDRIQRVVLIDFPSESLKTVGFVTSTFPDSQTGEELAAVYVPTTPNPTSGYLEIVPVKKLIPTEWTLDDAMTFIISGGAVAPKSLSFYRRDELPLDKTR